MSERDNFKARGWNFDPYDIPVDEPHHHPPIEVVSHPLRNSIIYVHVIHGLGELS